MAVVYQNHTILFIFLSALTVFLLADNSVNDTNGGQSKVGNYINGRHLKISASQVNL